MRPTKTVYTTTKDVYIAFCTDSWKVFQTERIALEWVVQRERRGELWGLTPGQVSFSLPRGSDDDEK